MTEVSANADFQYAGRELRIFSEAHNWKSYVARQLAPAIGRRVLEVGTGLGAMTRVIAKSPVEEWLCLEPDEGLCGLLRENLANWGLMQCRAQVGTLADIPDVTSFDTILYLDVLEHISDDAAELRLAARRLASGGSLVVLAPAHQWLFTEFDQEIGHYRRYSRSRLRKLTPPGMRLVRQRYLDSVGMLASLGNKLFLHASSPTMGQVLFWDRVLVSSSVVVDPLLGFSVGKSVMTIWRKIDA